MCIFGGFKEWIIEIWLNELNSELKWNNCHTDIITNI